ncbi:MAG: helix-turn-helix domain-containing protein [Candidatus Moraniibacteriota bacterium]
MDIQKIFEHLGMPKYADAVYLLLRQEGPMGSTHISKKLGIYQPSTYRVLPALLAYRFVYITKKGRRKAYHAVNPRFVEKTFLENPDAITKIIEKRTRRKRSHKKVPS